VTSEPYYFQDEMRFGTRTELGKRWTACSVRPLGEQLLGYEYGYLSLALNRRTGELFALLLPDMRLESFQAFLDEFVKFISQQRFVRLMTDGAAAHRSTRLKIDQALRIEHLPYSPELNPVERLFRRVASGIEESRV